MKRGEFERIGGGKGETEVQRGEFGEKFKQFFIWVRFEWMMRGRVRTERESIELERENYSKNGGEMRKKKGNQSV